jgi:hypothetical protein
MVRAWLYGASTSSSRGIEEETGNRKRQHEEQQGSDHASTQLAEVVDHCHPPAVGVAGRTDITPMTPAIVMSVDLVGRARRRGDDGGVLDSVCVSTLSSSFKPLVSA